MPEGHASASSGKWGTSESVVLGVALVGFAVAWALFVTAPPDGLISPYGMAISLPAVAYLAFLLFSYLKWY